MATATLTPTSPKTLPETRLFQWDPGTLTSSDTFPSQELSGNADRSVQLIGAAGGGGFNGCTVVIEGSNDNTNFQTLTDGLGNPLSFTAAGLKQICECVRYIRPKVSSGTAGTTLTALIFTRV